MNSSVSRRECRFLNSRVASEGEWDSNTWRITERGNFGPSEVNPSIEQIGRENLTTDFPEEAVLLKSSPRFTMCRTTTLESLSKTPPRFTKSTSVHPSNLQTQKYHILLRSSLFIYTTFFPFYIPSNFQILLVKIPFLGAQLRFIRSSLSDFPHIHLLCEKTWITLDARIQQKVRLLEFGDQ